jgi:signal transduction histidine kinase
MKKGIHATFLKNYAIGREFYNKAWELYKQLHMVEGEMYAMNCLSWNLSESGKLKEAYDMMKKLSYIKDSVFREETANKTALFRTLYETEKKEKENVALSKDVSLKKLQIANEKRSKRQLAIIFGISVLGIIAVFAVAYSRYKLKKKAELDLQIAAQEQLRFKAVIEAEENERERIAADLHDGVGQMMSAAKINLSTIESEIPFATEEQRSVYHKVLALVDESCREVRIVSHSMMPNALLKSGLVNAIRSFINQIDSRIIQINLYTEGLNERLPSEVENVLYRVVQECVNNVIKHSKASQLDISIIKDEDGISATIEDNGVGFNINDRSKFEGIGIKNIISRISYLKGTVEWDSAPGKGTVVAIHLPVA